MHLPFSIPAAVLLPCLFVSAGEIPSFNKDIRPILVKNCTACHGGVKAAGKISFIYKEQALGMGKSGEICIVPGKPEASELIRRVLSKDPEEVMPKPEHGPALSAKEIATLTAWVAAGAPWEEHWAFMPPVDHPPPSPTDAAWAKQPLDHFLRARLEKEGLQPSPTASAAEWLRRASLDITGLPPDAEAWASLQADWATDADRAKSAAADKMLASPHFGERWASLWLDLARYADTQGFEKDLDRTMWPFRDWAIRAFNADMPFSEFTVRQLAGDLLEKPDLVATAFHRNTWTNTEGGTDDEEYRVAAVVDRVNTTWTAWQATTFGCTQCHSHPYDPFAHDEYYKFMAFFDNTEDADLDNEYPKIIATNDPAQQAAQDKRTLDVQTARHALNAAALVSAKEIGNWTRVRPSILTPSAKTGTLALGEDGIITAGGTNPTSSNYKLTIPSMEFGALRLSILPQEQDPKLWLELASVVSRFQIFHVAKDGKKEEIPLAEVVADFITGPFDPQASLDGDPGGFGPYPALTGPRWCILVPKQPIKPVADTTLEIVITHAVSCNASNQPSILRKFTLETTPDQRLVEFASSKQRAEAWEAWRQLKKHAESIPGTKLPGLIQRQQQANRTTRVFVRGNRMTRDAAVTEGIPIISRPPAIEKPTRLDMANWLVSDNNTLTARVLANRLWAELFGIGIVETQEDFGSSGLPPTHPELLDHLSIRLSKHHGWRIKPMLKELVLSAAYGQQNKTDAALALRDAKNKLLARGPRTRLTAEMLRDQNLLASGLLSRKQFGKPVFPPQPDGVWNSVYNGSKWETSQGEDRYRRSIYTYWKRTSAYPSFITFDMASRDICSARRLPTNTPLQALVTLNDPAYLEMAQALAKQAIAASPELAGRINNMHQRLLLLPASDKTQEVLASLFADTVARYQTNAADMKPLGETAEIAALTMVANTLMNTDASLTK